MSEIIRTLIVDDSAFVRKIVRQMLSRSPYIEVVGAARDGNEALEMTEALEPDVITCDLTMPHRDGVEFVREQMSRKPVPILILSASPQDGEKVLEAMEAGAVDFLQKPSALANEEILVITENLLEKVKAASRISVHKAADSSPSPEVIIPSSPRRDLKVDLVVLGISTGGPQALRKLLPSFPADFPVCIAIVIHMPLGYTQLYAEKLDEISLLDVEEARDGMFLRPGHVIIAQAGRHLTIRRNAKGLVQTHLAMQPLDLPHRPSVDVLFQSAAEIYKNRVLGVVMTGMGSDGKQGAAWIKSQGGSVLTEAEESCVIYGMPRSVVESGLSDGQIPLEGMAQAIFDRI